MIIRIWLPLHAALRQRRPLALFLLIGLGVSGVAGLLEYPQLREPALLAGIALVLQIHAIVLQLAAGAILFAILTLGAALGLEADALLWLAAVNALILGPSIDFFRRLAPGAAAHATGRSGAFAILAGQFVLLGGMGHSAAALVVVPVVALLFITAGIIPAALVPQADAGSSGWCIPRCTPGAWWAVAGLALISIDIVLPQPVTFGEIDVWAWVTPVIWLGLAQRPWPVLGAILACTTVALRHGAHAVDSDAVLGFVPALMLWLGREPQRGIRAPMLFASWSLLAAMALAHPRWGSAALLGGVMLTWVALEPRPGKLLSGSLEGRARRSLYRQPPAWRWYHAAKWRWDPLYHHVVADPRPWGRVLDLGCGSGLAAVIGFLRPDTVSYVGVDGDLDKLLVAQAWLDSLGAPADFQRLLHDHAPTAVLEGERFDTVLLLDVLHYWQLAQQQILLEYALQLLTPEGRIILRDVAADSTGSTGRVGKGERFTTWLGLNPRQEMFFRDHTAWETLFTACNLTNISGIACGDCNYLWQLRRAESGISTLNQ